MKEVKEGPDSFPGIVYYEGAALAASQEVLGQLRLKDGQHINGGQFKKVLELNAAYLAATLDMRKLQGGKGLPNTEERHKELKRMNKGLDPYDPYEE